MSTAARVVIVLHFMRIFFHTSRTFLRTCWRKESNSTWYAFHAWHV